MRTGKRLWIFHTIPEPGEFGSDTWEQDSESYTGNAGVWAQISVDEELGTVFLPVEMPTGDYYGGHRPGAGLFGESLVAVDLRTGKRKWHYQFIHHGIWDWDLPCAPIIADVTIDGRMRKVVAQPTKQGWLYVFDRVTGEPIWPIEERKVEQSDVPMEKSWPTQRFVTKPPAYERQGVSIDDLIDFTPELRAEAVKLASRFKIGPIFTPPVVSKWPGPLATLMLPDATGGANWQGGSYDPETGTFYIFTNTNVVGARARAGLGASRQAIGHGLRPWTGRRSGQPQGAGRADHRAGPAADQAARTGASRRSICTRASCSGRWRTARRRTTCAIIRC